jgi:hypothetical protein
MEDERQVTLVITRHGVGYDRCRASWIGHVRGKRRVDAERAATAVSRSRLNRPSFGGNQRVVGFVANSPD